MTNTTNNTNTITNDDARTIAENIGVSLTDAAKKGLEVMAVAYVDAGRKLQTMIGDESNDVTSARSAAILGEHTEAGWARKQAAAKKDGKQCQPARLSTYNRTLTLADAIGRKDIAVQVRNFVDASEKAGTSTEFTAFVSFASNGWTLKVKDAKPAKTAAPIGDDDGENDGENDGDTVTMTPDMIAAKVCETYKLNSKADIVAVMGALANIVDTLKPVAVAS